MLLLACFLLPLCSGAADLARPNIIFILMDDLRWDEMDYPFVKVPNIQRIAREGVKFSKRVRHHPTLFAEPRQLSHRPIRA